MSVPGLSERAPCRVRFATHLGYVCIELGGPFSLPAVSMLCSDAWYARKKEDPEDRAGTFTDGVSGTATGLEAGSRCRRPGSHGLLDGTLLPP